MTLAALLVSFFLLVMTAFLRSAGASLVRTPRADALHDAAEGDERAARVAGILDDISRIQPSLGTVTSVLLVTAGVAAAWAVAAY